MASDDLILSHSLKRMYQILYLQFAFYWATIAVGMVVNYYYTVPNSLQPQALSILQAILTSPLILPHGIFAALSTGMSVPVIYYARKVGLRQVVWLHVGAILVRVGGFLGGPLFLYFSTSSVSQDVAANVSTFVMASVFMVAVALTFLSRIFVVQQDVYVKYQVSISKSQGGIRESELKKEEVGSLGLRGLGILLDLSYANFVVYLLLYFSGMYVNIWITSGVNTVVISNPINVFHMLVTALNFAFSFFVAGAGLIYGLKKAAMFSLGAIAAIVISALGGLLFLTTGGGRTSGSLTLAGGWIMSLLFMLAFFLAYYATLRIMRAIRITEAKRGKA